MGSRADLTSTTRPGEIEIAPAGVVEFSDQTQLGHRIEEILRTHGYAHLGTSIPEEEFEAVAGCLGSVDLRTDLIVDDARVRAQRKSRTQEIGGVRPAVYQSAGLDFHTDRPTVRVLGWYCVRQDDVDGASILLDTSGIFEAFTAEERQALTEVKVWYTLRDPRTDEEISCQERLLTPRDDGYDVYYAPWLVVEDFDGDELRARALEKLAEWIDRKTKNDFLRIRLQAGECLFINNRRMLHGRAAVAEDSKRHLVRLYLGAARPQG